MAPYVKRPRGVDAWKVRELIETYRCWGKLPELVDRAVKAGTISFYDDPGGKLIKIITLEGVLTASPESWLICGIKGEFYPCDPEVFAETYDPL